MIRIADAALLAFTKLRTRKIRTIATVFLASLLFGVLITMSLVINGGLTSLKNFRSDGLTSRYIVNVNRAIDSKELGKTLRDASLIAQAKEEYTKLVDEKAKEAKRLNIPYTQASDQPPYIDTLDGKGNILSINDPNGITQKILAQRYSASPYLDEAKLDSIAKRYGSVNSFEIESYTLASGSSLEVFPNGREKFYDASDPAALEENYVVPIIDPSLSLLPPELTKPFMLPENAGWTPDSGSIPIILPQDIIERLVGLDKLPANTSAATKIERITEVKKRAMSLIFDACYRNKTSVELIQQIIKQNAEEDAHADDNEYQKPSLLYALPNPTSCNSPYVVKDDRTTEQKQQDANQAIFDKKFNNKLDADSHFVHFKVVGISPERTAPQPDAQSSTISNVSDIVNNLLATNGIGQAVPKELYDQIVDKTSYKDIFTYLPMYIFGNEDNRIRYVEFASALDAQKFIDDQSCSTQYDGSCKPFGRLYQASLSFSNSVALDDLRNKSDRFFQGVTLGVMLLATLIMWTVVSRTISDSRRETAVFRAIGFKKTDIGAIYVVYVLFLCLLTILLSIAIGYAGAYISDMMLSPQLTAQAQYGFGAIDLTKKVNLVDVRKDQILTIIAAIVATGLLSVVLPLIRNLRRNPVMDMRDE